MVQRRGRSLHQRCRQPGADVRHGHAARILHQTVPHWFSSAWGHFQSGVVTPVENWFKGLPGKIGGWISGIWDGLKSGFITVINWIIDQLNKLHFNTHIPGVGVVGVPHIDHVGGGHAAGTGFAAPGWAWVGEEGPELLKFAGGETVLPHGTSVEAARGYAAGVGSATPAAASGGADLKKQANKDAKDVGDTWAKSGKSWYDTAKDALKKQVADPAAALIKTEIPGQWNKAIPATWYAANPATLAKQVAAPAATLITKTLPGQWGATVPKWYDASPAALAKAVATPAATLIKTTIPAQFASTIPHWYDSHAATFQSKVIGPQTTWFKSTLPGDVKAGMTQAIANIVTPTNSVIGKVNTTVLGSGRQGGRSESPDHPDDQNGARRQTSPGYAPGRRLDPPSWPARGEGILVTEVVKGPRRRRGHRRPSTRNTPGTAAREIITAASGSR